MVGILWRKYVYMYTITVYMYTFTVYMTLYTITVYNISGGLYVKGILYSPDAGHSGR